MITASLRAPVRIDVQIPIRELSLIFHLQVASSSQVFKQSERLSRLLGLKTWSNAAVAKDRLDNTKIRGKNQHCPTSEELSPALLLAVLCNI